MARPYRAEAKTEYKQLFRLASEDERRILGLALTKLDRATLAWDEYELAAAHMIILKVLQTMQIQQGQRGINRKHAGVTPEHRKKLIASTRARWARSRERYANQIRP